MSAWQITRKDLLLLVKDKRAVVDLTTDDDSPDDANQHPE